MINGIEGDEYGFTETHSDAGYSLLKKEVIVKVKETKADITPTEANITGIQSKSDADSTANDGVPNGTVLKNDVTVQTTAASATVDETKATMTKHDDSGNAYINMQITNQKQFMLPMTGGAGNYLLIIAGVVVAGCGILILNKTEDDHKDKMKQKIISILVILAGFFLLSYPFVSNYLFEKSAGSTVESYQEKAAGMDQAIIKK